jgi:hypothetical protein
MLESFQPKGCGPGGMFWQAGNGIGLTVGGTSGAGSGEGFSFLQENKSNSAKNSMELEVFKKDKYWITFLRG